MNPWVHLEAHRILTDTHKNTAGVSEETSKGICEEAKRVFLAVLMLNGGCEDGRATSSPETHIETPTAPGNGQHVAYKTHKCLTDDSCQYRRGKESSETATAQRPDDEKHRAKKQTCQCIRHSRGR